MFFSVGQACTADLPDERNDAANGDGIGFSLSSHFADIDAVFGSPCEIAKELRLFLPTFAWGAWAGRGSAKTAVLLLRPPAHAPYIAFRRKSVKASRPLRWSMAVSIAALLVVAPFIYYRYGYTYSKRLRVVVPGQLYRSGQMTEPGFRDAIRRLGIRTVLNVQDDNLDPELARGYFSDATILESQLCKEMGVRYAVIAPDLVDPRLLPQKRPKAIEKFLALMDDKRNFPVLIHCKAGLHRTGCLVAIYRMEYEGWTMEQALTELKGHGFGEFVSTKANAYILDYVTSYQPRKRNSFGRAPQASAGAAFRRSSPLNPTKW
jgi:hypothetical protein